MRLGLLASGRGGNADAILTAGSDVVEDEIFYIAATDAAAGADLRTQLGL